MQSLYLAQYDAFIRWHQLGHTGPKLVYLPGLSLPAAGCFVPLASHLAMAGTTAILLDYLGSGVSDTAPGFEYSLAAHADSVAAVMDHLGCGPCPIMGYSMGGSVAIELALRRPDLVSRLIVAEGNLFPGGGVASRRIAGMTMAEFIEHDLPATLAHLRAAAVAGDERAGFIAAAWAVADPRGIYENAKMLVTIAPDFADRFFDMALPRHFFIGEKTLAEPPSPDRPEMGLLEGHGIGTALIAGVGHELMRGNAAGFADALAASLR